MHWVGRSDTGTYENSGVVLFFVRRREKMKEDEDLEFPGTPTAQRKTKRKSKASDREFFTSSVDEVELKTSYD